MGKPKPTLLTRRRLLLGLGSLGLAGAAAAWFRRSPAIAVRVPPVEGDLPQFGESLSPMAMLRDFDYGTAKQENGRTVREFHLTADTATLELNRAVSFVSWNYNGRVPGPTLRVKEGDRVRIIFHNEGGHSHSIHFHGIHPAEMDGVDPVRNGDEVVYEFDAKPFGLHLYHCHIEPVTRHLSKGLYGLFIVDPPQGRSPADELVLIMAGYDTNDDDRNELYAFNGIPDYFYDRPIRIYQNQPVRIYLLNAIEFESAATFHLHANFFKVYPTGMTLTPTTESDVVTLGTMERHIIEFSYIYPGTYMFHPHQDLIAEHGCMGKFEVLPA